MRYLLLFILSCQFYYLITGNDEDDGADSSETNEEVQELNITNVVPIGHHKDNESYVCTGILFSPKTVVTTADCFYDKFENLLDDPDIYVIMGKDNPQHYPVDKITIHPYFNLKSKRNNIGILTLGHKYHDAEINYDDLFVMDVNYGDSCFIAYYSHDDAGKTNTKLKGVKGEVIHNEDCIDKYEKHGVIIPSRHVCVEASPSFCYNGESAVLICNDKAVGLLAQKIQVPNIDDNFPFVYLNLDDYENFVQKSISLSKANGQNLFKMLSTLLCMLFTIIVTF